MLDEIAQVGVFVLSILAVVLVSRKNRWGFVSGLLSQPFWLITSYLNGQIGVFAVSIAMAVSWSYGVYNWFFKNNQNNR